MNFNSGRYVERFLIAAAVALAVPLSAVAFGGPHGAPNSCGAGEVHGKGRPDGMGGERMPPYLRGLSLSLLVVAQHDAQRCLLLGVVRVGCRKRALKVAAGDVTLQCGTQEIAIRRCRAGHDANPAARILNTAHRDGFQRPRVHRHR